MYVLISPVNNNKKNVRGIPISMNMAELKLTFRKSDQKTWASSKKVTFKLFLIFLVIFVHCRNGQHLCYAATADTEHEVILTSTVVPNASVAPCTELSDDNCFVMPTTATESHSHWKLRDEAWVIPLMAMSVFNITVISFFEMFVLIKTFYTRPSRRHLFLGQVLLLALFFSSLVGFIFVFLPNTITCAVARLGVGLAYSVVLSTLLVKCIFLISLNNGVYLPAAYLGLLLFFAILVQMVVGVQWLVLVPPSIIHSDGVYYDGGAVPPSCNHTFTELLFSLVYVMFLLLFAVVLAIKSCGIRENYREATYIAITVGFMIIVWITWMVIGLTMGDEYEIPCIAFGLVGSAAACFLVMFLPKGRQLAAMGQEGLYVEDRDDRMSNASPSAFAPSFYHFTPAVMPVWDSSTNAIYKNAVQDRKFTKYAVPKREHPYATACKRGEIGHIAGRAVSLGPLNIHNSMMY